MTPRAHMTVRYHGTRGSIPTPEPTHVRHGGNTPCVEVLLADGHRIVLDAGSGARLLGRDSARNGHDVDILLSHLHWDHVQGLPFCAPLHQTEAHVRIHAPGPVAELLGTRLAPDYFPVPVTDLPARPTLHMLDSQPLRIGSAEITTCRVRHPSVTCALRIASVAGTVVYVPDNELTDDRASWAALAAFVAGADLLIHDAFFTTAEYARHTGWGHSTFEQATLFAEQAGVATLHFFHHHPERTDASLDQIVATQRAALVASGSPLCVAAAAEGESVVIEAADGGSTAAAGVSVAQAAGGAA